MKRLLTIETLTALAMLMGILMIAGLMLCNIYIIAISEMLAVIIIGMRFLLTNKTQEITS